MNKITLVFGAAILVGFLVGVGMAQEQDESETCAVCHDDIAASMKLNAHGLAQRDAPSCVSCHGDGQAHMEEGDPALIAIPSGREAAATCMTCHSDLHAGFAGGKVHERAGVNCETCHSMHASDHGVDAMLVSNRTELCESCHPSQVRSFNRRFGHRLGRSGLECVSCHNPHGGAEERSLKVDRSGDIVCMSCHSDLRGPFVFPHVSGVTGDCMTCHEPHGSSNPHALRRAHVDRLCLECHSPMGGDMLGSQPPSSHDLLSPRFRNCTTCHVAVHGSNTSPTLRK